MKIASASVEMEGSRFAFSQHSVRERLEAWVGERPARTDTDRAPGRLIAEAAREQVRISAEAAAAHEAEAARGETDAAQSDPRIRILKQIIEALTGRRIRTLRASDLGGGEHAVRHPAWAPAHNGRDEGGARGAGFGLAYERHATYTEYEHTRFAAAGTIRTADGREIRFELAVEMERMFHQSSHAELRLGDARLKDPLVLDFAGPAAALSEARFSFDLDADGRQDEVPMLGGGLGYLAFDRNANGRIDDGSEIFGPTSGDGFAELALFDADGNGWIDEADPDFARLAVWSPASEGTGALLDLTASGIGALYLGRVATPFELRGAANESLGVVRTSSLYLRDDGTAGTVSQIDLSV